MRLGIVTTAIVTRRTTVVADRRPETKSGWDRNGTFAGGSQPVCVKMLGGFRVGVGPRTIEENDWRLRKAASLVKLLALAPGHRLHREQAMETLWPGSGRRSASNNLRQALHYARRTLAPDPGEGSLYLRSEGESLVLGPPGGLRVDVETFEAAALSAQRGREPAAYASALDLYGGGLLPGDRYEDWVEERRRELRGTYTSLSLGLARAYEEHGEHGSALAALREVIGEELTNEEAHAGAMRLYALSGRRTDALKQYETLAEIASRELGTEPSASTRALREEIASGRFPPRPALPCAPRAMGETDPPRHNLPEPRTSFVGRGQELARARRALVTTRLLTLTGAGGSGKTRLALRAATGVLGAYPDGTWFTDLARLSEPDLVPQAVASAVGAREQPGRPPAETVVEHLGEKRALLVLDNCEHLIDAAAHLVELLLASCHRLRVVATSREPLGVAGEALFPVPPLPVPPDRPSEPGEAENNDAVCLFVERARLKLPGFTLTRANVRAVIEVCRRLEGIPLAIELAAARMGTLATERVAERLRDSLDLLSAGPRTAPARQRTMRAAIEWSYGLLPGPEKEIFRRLSVFSGGFMLEAAEAVCPGGAIGRREVLDLVTGLADRSLVAVDTTAEGRVRYRVLEPIRQYAREYLEEVGEAEEVGRRHAAYFLDFAEGVEPQLRGKGQVQCLGRLEEDNGNLRAAMAWLLEKGEVEDAVRLASALWIFWLIHGHQHEGRRWIEEALAKGENLTAHARAEALWVRASTYYGLGTAEELERICREAAPLFRQVGDDVGLAYALAGMATARMQLGDVERAIALFEEASELSRATGEKWGMSGGLVHLGSAYLGQGDYEGAARCFGEGLALAREIGNNLAASAAFYGLAMAARGQGDHDRAAKLYADGLQSAAEAGDKANIAYTLEGLAQVAAARGEAGRAVRLFGAAEAALEDAGGTLYPYAQARSASEQAVDDLRSRMDQAAFSVAWSEGRAMSPGEAVEYALSGGGTVAPAATAVPEPQPTGARPVSLTRRQEEIAALIARGMTNRQIAKDLFVSENTVANHVARILKKLGLCSRSQVAAWLAEQRTLPSA